MNPRAITPTELKVRWTRPVALKLRDIHDKMGLCGCGTTGRESYWAVLLNLLEEAEDHTEIGFYQNRWFEFGAKVLDSWGLLEHGSGIGGAWLTEDGALLLQFIRDFGVDNKFHPDWLEEYGWGTNPDPMGDTFSDWFDSLQEIHQ